MSKRYMGVCSFCNREMVVTHINEPRCRSCKRKIENGYRNSDDHRQIEKTAKPNPPKNKCPGHTNLDGTHHKCGKPAYGQCENCYSIDLNKRLPLQDGVYTIHSGIIYTER